MPRPPRLTTASGPRSAISRPPGLLAFAAACAQHAPVPEDIRIPAAANERPVPANSSHVPRATHPPSATHPADSSHIPKDSPPSPGPPVPGDISSSSRLAPPPPGLVDLRAELPGACFDVRYATANNFTGAILPGYAAAGAWLRPRPAGALAR